MLKNLYLAAALFTARETMFNLEIANGLEAHGHEVFLPQRDGFEFSILANALIDKIEKDDIEQAVQNIIYIFDIGKKLPGCDLVIANLDEPLDEGVLIEISYAKLMNIPVIGFRTGARMPFGTNAMLGIHFFPAFQCDTFICQRVYCKTSNEELMTLVNEIDTEVRCIDKRNKEIPKIANEIVDASNKIFNDVDFKSSDYIDKIVSNYKVHKDTFNSIYPKITKLGS